MASNQGRDLDPVLRDVPHAVLLDAAAVIRREEANHPGGATCACPALEALAFLYERGYRVVRDGG